MKRAILMSCLIAGGLSLGAGIALAKGPAGGPGLEPIQFEQLDTDQSGEITREEMQNVARLRFEAADANGDGMLSLEELQAQARTRADERASRMMDRMDANSDGQLAMEEMRPPRGEGRMFGRIDADGSGGISQEEFATAQERMRDRDQKRRAN
ncbi:EF-hand domain-containing protein [Thalassococcus sp. S3]|uniref:EF-hand domain-containing protein n=1 Tax=Thalassococcus sp. S3 TaxID=2017482 RepID=UPI0013EE9E22|nr:EF-hand domain-containing protein [Thalassococcus sp. S3]